MELAKIDLSAIAAVGHDDEYLGLLIERGDELEYQEVYAPIEAYEGLQAIAELANQDGQITQNYDTLQSNSVIYNYQQTVEIKITETITIIAPDGFTDVAADSLLTTVDYDPDSECLKLEFDDGSSYEYQEVDEELWTKFQEIYQ